MDKVLSERSESVLVSGLLVPEAPLRTLRAGPLEVDYQSGFLRYIRAGGSEVLRLVNFALRDHNWETVPFAIEDEVIEEGEQTFSIRYRAVYKSPTINYEAKVTFSGNAEGRLKLAFEGTVKNEFRRNRIGFTVLHPLVECVGQEVEATHSDGSIETSQFPDLISPHQPLFDLAQLKWKSGQWQATLRFSGDVFEMEDQRNWTDASFKTYCTPLGIPYPVTLQAGDRVCQEIDLSVSGIEIQNGRKFESTETVHLSNPCVWRALPKLGLCQSQENAELSSVERGRIAKLRLSHYRVAVDLSDRDWVKKWTAATTDAESMGLLIELAIFLRNPEEFQIVLQKLEEAADQVESILLLPKERKVFPQPWVPVLAKRIQGVFPAVKIGAGTDAFFTELNRERLLPDDLDFVSYTFNPQVHAFDNLSLVETLEAQGETVRTARSFSRAARIHIGPVSLRMRWNPNATEAEPETPAGELPADVDLRQLSLFGAAWTLGTIERLCRAGADSVSFYEAIGERGVMQVRSPAHPELFPAAAGEVYPVYHVFRELAGVRSVCCLDASLPRKVVALLAETDAGDRLLLANLSSESVRVDLSSVFEAHRIRLLDAEVWQQLPGVSDGIPFPGTAFGEDVCTLSPHALAVLEGFTGGQRAVVAAQL